jgi:hypothetical protein
MILLLLAVGMQATLSAQSEERWRIPDSALATVVHEVDAIAALPTAAHTFLQSAGSLKLVAMRRFGEIAAFSDPDTFSPCRFHYVGRSILEQLRRLGIDDIRKAVETATTGSSGSPVHLPSVFLRDENVVANYLLHHLVALHLAGLAGQVRDDRSSLLAAALEYEARALGFLVDAFSPGHMRVPSRDLLSVLHIVNTREAHDFYNSQGLYVINSRGEMWQAFGDNLVQWYAPSWRHVFEACCMSLREMIFVYVWQSKSNLVPGILLGALGVPSGEDAIGARAVSWLTYESGDHYYVRAKMPTLLMIPFPVSATWSVRTMETDQHGMRIRRHYPQIEGEGMEAGFSDSTLTGPASKLLPTWDALPPWMLPDSWLPSRYLMGQKIRDLSVERRRALVTTLVANDTAVASVRFIQEVDYPASYTGPIVSIGGGVLWSGGDRLGSVAISAGYAPPWGLFPDLLAKLRISGTVSLGSSLDNFDKMLLSERIGITIPLLPFGIRFEGGYTEGLGSLLHSSGWVVGCGLEMAMIPLGFTYGGILVKPRFDVHYLPQRVSTAMVELVII